MTILDKIAAYKREEVERAKAQTPLRALEEKIAGAQALLGFRKALEQQRSRGEFGLIAEIKKASPSKGVIRADFDPKALARAYEKGGASCLSVLTDTASFDGRPEYIALAKSTASLPVLRKDFMLDPYQVAEARALGADCILIIMAMLGAEQAREIFSDAREHHGMDVLVEVHDEPELERALTLGAGMIGINNRDLRTFETDLGVTLRLAPEIPGDVLVVSESGIESYDDLLRLRDAGVTTFLVGESLMRQPDVAAATCTLLGSKVIP